MLRGDVSDERGSGCQGLGASPAYDARLQGIGLQLAGDPGSLPQHGG